MKKLKYSELEKIKLKKIKKLDELGFQPWGHAFKPKNFSKEIHEKYEKKTKIELQKLQKEVTLTGRLMLIRGQGKASFATLRDFHGDIQIYIREDEVSRKEFKAWSLVDIGDIVGIIGSIMKTNHGELTIRVKKYIPLVKAIKSLPDKHKGLVNKEEIYRKRYVDLIINEKSKKVFFKRSLIIKTIKSYFESLGFLEVDTPLLHPVFGGAAAAPFVTHHNVLDMKLYLRIAPELYLKRLLIGGYDKVYELGKQFRNEGISFKHNPEFTSVELYQAYADYNDMMNIVEGTILHITKVLKIKDLIYEGQNINFKTPFKRVKMVDLVKKVTKEDFTKVKNFSEAKLIAKKHKLEIPKHFYGVGHIVNLFFEEFCEKELINPTFVYEYPIEVSPLAKRNTKNVNYTDRFEFFIGAREYANAFTELNEPEDQFYRFLQQLKEKESGNKEANEVDYDYIEALQYGMPPAGGLGIGVDRLVMLFTNSHSIRDVILFPHMRNKEKDGGTNGPQTF